MSLNFSQERFRRAFWLRRRNALSHALDTRNTRSGNEGYRVLELRRPDVSQTWVRVHLRPNPTSGVPRMAGIER